MISAIVICTLYVALLFGITKLFGVKYTEITKTTDNIKKGLLLPVSIVTIILTLFAVIFNWIPDVFTFSPRNENIILWVIPFIYVVGIFIRLQHAAWKDFTKKGLLYLFFGSLLVGFSEELLVRGVVVTALLDSGYTILLTGVISSVIFGALHIINYFNGQSFKITLLQVVATTLMGINFYVVFIITGTLWAPMLLHFIFDFSLLVQGGDLNKLSGKEKKVEPILALLLYVAALGALFLI